MPELIPIQSQQGQGLDADPTTRAPERAREGYLAEVALEFTALVLVWWFAYLTMSASVNFALGVGNSQAMRTDELMTLFAAGPFFVGIGSRLLLDIRRNLRRLPERAKPRNPRAN